jgi:Uma2 family endonuclease
MDTAERTGKVWTADDFLATDQREFGDAWRYELVDGVIVAHAALSPDHGAILASLTMALGSRLRGRWNGCRVEAGSGATSRSQQRSTARIPDAMIPCGEHPRVVFEIVSPSELRAWGARDRKRRDEQDVEGVQEIVELYQGEAAAHIYRREDGGGWSFDAIGGLNAVLSLKSVALRVPLAEIYESVDLGPDDEADA